MHLPQGTQYVYLSRRRAQLYQKLAHLEAAYEKRSKDTRVPRRKVSGFGRSVETIFETDGKAAAEGRVRDSFCLKKGSSPSCAHSSLTHGLSDERVTHAPEHKVFAVSL